MTFISPTGSLFWHRLCRGERGRADLCECKNDSKADTQIWWIDKTERGDLTRLREMEWWRCSISYSPCCLNGDWLLLLIGEKSQLEPKACMYERQMYTYLLFSFWIWNLLVLQAMPQPPMVPLRNEAEKTRPTRCLGNPFPMRNHPKHLVIIISMWFIASK